MKKIFVLHEYGSPSHYYGLQALCEQNNVRVIYREFRVFHLIGSGIEHRNLKRILKQFVNFLFLISLPFRKREKVLLAACPYDWKLRVLSLLLRKHSVYYHTSYTLWNDEKILKASANVSFWRDFMNNKAVRIFAVTEQAKAELSRFLGHEDKICVVYHSYRNTMPVQDKFNKDKFIFVGRMDEDKGVRELCEYFINNKDKNLILIGSGELNSYVRKISRENSNIIFVGYLHGINRIVPYYLESGFFILNSKKTKTWEELFGLVLIESMAVGCIPIAVEHSGPKEIIKNGEDGFLFKEGGLYKALDNIATIKKDKLERIKKNAINKGQSFYCGNVAKRWESILD